MVALLAAATSCDKYDIYPEQYGKVLMIKDAGEKNVTIYATETDAPYYVSVMKNGHNPEDPAQATLKILNEAEFGEYKELYYGSKDFKGLQFLNPEYYYLADGDMVAAESKKVDHEFTSADDRYFGAYIVFNAQKISDWRADLEKRASDSNKTKNPAEWQAADDTLQNFTFVVPVGLYSANMNDSINADNRYLMLIPVVENPIISCSVSNDAAYIVDQNRSLLKDENSEYRKGSYCPEITLSLPCPNPYGFQIKFNNNPSVDIARFNGHHTDMKLDKIDKRDPVTKEENFTLGDGNAVIDFPAGKTEVRIPCEFFRSKMDYDSDLTFATSVQLKGFNWNNKETPQKVKNSIKLPESSLTWTSNSKFPGDDGRYDGYTFFIGYRVVEEPMDLDGGCIIGANDPETTEGSFDALFDDDLSTFYHSAWSDEARKDRTAKYASYLDIEVPSTQPINAVAFKCTARVHSNPHGPKVVKLFYSNGKTEADREASWKAMVKNGKEEIEVTGSTKSGEVSWVGQIKKPSDWIRADESFKYVRFCVFENNFNEKLTSIGSKGAGYWNLAELRMYGTYLKD